MYGWKHGLKTGTYYIRSKAASSVQNFTLDPNTEELFKKELLENEEDICEMCSA